MVRDIDTFVVCCQWCLSFPPKAKNEDILAAQLVCQSEKCKWLWPFRPNPSFYNGEQQRLLNWIKLDWDEKTGTNMSAHEREKHLHFLPGGSDRRSFLRPGFNPPLKAKSWLGAWRHVSMCSSGLSTLNNRVGIIHILHSSRFTILTLNRNQLFESHYSINPLYKKKMRVKFWPQNDPKSPTNFELSFTQNVVNLVQCVVVHLGVVWTLEYEQISMIERLPPSLLTAVMNAHWFSFVENWVDFSCIRNRLEVRFICSMRDMVGHKKEFAGWLVCNLLTRSRP